jgi:solute carrier family 13 (sodium-dependent dicarboxylate transporter), member 2/3/5
MPVIMETSELDATKVRAPAGTPGKLDARVVVGRVLSVVGAVALWLAPLKFVDIGARHALAIGLFMIVAWITDALPHVTTGLIGCFLFWSLGVVGFGSAFSGFSTEAPWFYFGAMLFGMLATQTGLANRFAFHLMLRFGNTYSKVLLGLVILSFLLTFFVPSGAVCVVIMASVAIGLLEAYGFGRNSNIARGMFLTLTYTAGLFDKMVVAGPSSILGRELIIKTTHTEIYWSKWFLAYLPFSLITIVVTWRLVLWLFPCEQAILTGGEEYLRGRLLEMGRWTRREKHAAVLLLVALALWVTDSLHHISPAIIGLGIGLIAVLPAIGVLTVKDIEKVNYTVMFFIAAAASLGQVLIQTKAIDVLTHATFAWMAPLLTGRFTQAIVPYCVGFVYHIFSGNDISMLATSIPPLMNFAVAQKINPVTLGMIWVLAAGGKIFVYQSGVLIMGYGYGYFETKDLLRLGLLVSAAEALLILVLVPYYWPLIGV